MTVKITSNQENRITDLVRDAVRALGLSKVEAQEIIEAGGMLQAQVKPILQKLAMADSRFGPAIKDFKFMVPSDYKHGTQLDTFAEKTKEWKTTFFFNGALTSENFAKATSPLLPEKTYRVRIFPILERVTSDDCLIFLAQQKAILVGAQGITLLQDKAPEEFPVDKWTVSFDEKDALWQDAYGLYRVPRVFRYSDGDWQFNLGYLERVWHDAYCLLCFCDE